MSHAVRTRLKRYTYVVPILMNNNNNNDVVTMLERLVTRSIFCGDENRLKAIRM